MRLGVSWFLSDHSYDPYLRKFITFLAFMWIFHIGLKNGRQNIVISRSTSNARYWCTGEQPYECRYIYKISEV